jgi:pimeloyl-ACP methyl ester carboxylesterase
MIYLISGLGTNEKAFARIHLGNRPFTFLPWIKPQKNEPLEHYLDRFGAGINPNEEIIFIGLSMGGMIAQNLATRYNTSKIILISSVVSEKEYSKLFRFFRFTGLYKLAPVRLLLHFRFLIYHIFGASSGKEKKFIIGLLADADPKLTHWSLNVVAKWKQVFTNPPANLYRIHGTKDPIFPSKYIGKAHLIEGGSHVMIVTKATAVNQWLKEILDKT